MSFNSTSPTNYGFEGDPLLEAYMNAKFSEEISEKMKVPKRITANGQEIEHEILNGNGMNSWNYYEKHDMTVPDRIVVIGQDQHLGKLKWMIFKIFALFTFFPPICFLVKSCLIKIVTVFRPQSIFPFSHSLSHLTSCFSF